MLISLKEAAEIMGILSKAVKREQNRAWELLPHLLKMGFPARKLGRRWFVHKEQLVEWTAKNWRNGKAAS